MRNGTYKCGLCASKVEQCHTTADYGPCLSNESFKIKNKRSGCKYRTFDEDYTVDNKDTRDEKVFIGDGTKKYYTHLLKLSHCCESSWKLIQHLFD
jgi:ATP-dependent DNA helicase DinG